MRFMIPFPIRLSSIKVAMWPCVSPRLIVPLCSHFSCQNFCLLIKNCLWRRLYSAMAEKCEFVTFNDFFLKTSSHTFSPQICFSLNFTLHFAFNRSIKLVQFVAMSFPLKDLPHKEGNKDLDINFLKAPHAKANARTNLEYNPSERFAIAQRNRGHSEQ